MQWFLGLLLPGTFFKARPLAAQTQLDHVLRVHVLRTVFDDTLHVAPLRTDETPRHLELFVVGDLDVEPTGVLDGGVVHVVAEVLGLVCRHHKRLRLEMACTREHVFLLEHGLRRL